MKKEKICPFMSNKTNHVVEGKVVFVKVYCQEEHCKAWGVLKDWETEKVEGCKLIERRS